MLSKFGGGARDSREVRPLDAAQRVRNSDKEVRRGLPVSGLVPHINEVLSRLVGRAIVCHPPFVDDANFVEMLVKRF